MGVNNMPFQGVVNRSYTTSFPGSIQQGGPHRARVARILSVNDPAGVNTNRISRAFGWSADYGNIGQGSSLTVAADGFQVVLGGSRFFGILFNPKHNALSGTTPNGLTGGSLGATLDLPEGTEAEFTDMCTGLTAELYNFTTGAVTPSFGDPIAYVPNTISTGNNPLAVPYGALVSYVAGAAVPTGLIAIPNAFVVNSVAISASAVGALVSAYTIIQLTQ
jgi:hypothetical protein